MNVQLILVLTLAILTISIAAVCFYIINILKDVKDTIKRTNTILDDAQGLTSKLAHPTPTLLSIAESTISAVKALKEITHREDHSRPEAQSVDENAYVESVAVEGEFVETEAPEKASKNMKEQITNLFDMPRKTKEKNFFRGTFKQ